MRRCALLLACLLVQAIPAAAQEPESGDFSTTRIINIRSDPRRCNLDAARRITIDGLIRDYGTILGRCVAVHGYWSTRGLFERREDGLTDDGRIPRIGLYGEEDIRAHAPRYRARAAIIAGTVQSCEDLWQRAGDLSGYCHGHAEGPVLALTEVELLD